MVKMNVVGTGLSCSTQKYLLTTTKPNFFNLFELMW